MNPKCTNHGVSNCPICWTWLPKPSLLRDEEKREEPRRPRFHISNNVYGGIRVWLEWLPLHYGDREAGERRELMAVLDNLSVWGSADKINPQHYWCWEIDDALIRLVRRAMNRYSIQLDEAEIPEWL